MRPRRRLPERTRRVVAERAGHRCEYCRHRDDFAYDPFEIEHIVPLADPAGTDALNNLAYSCGGCNGLKGVLRRSLSREGLHPPDDTGR